MLTELDKDKFLIELKELMKKYNVSIGFSVSDCSDTYWLSYERIVVTHYNKDSFKEEEWLSVDGWGMDHTDIK